MKYHLDGFNYILRFEKGEELVSALSEFVKKEEISGAWLSGLGAALWVELGYYDLVAGKYIWKRLDETLEITSLQGNIAWQNNAPVLHIHGSFSDKDMNGYGGHVKALSVGGTCEVFLHLLQDKEPLRRFHDEATGLNLLNL